jgi:hypothetical protein
LLWGIRGENPIPADQVRYVDPQNGCEVIQGGQAVNASDAAFDLG